MSVSTWFTDFNQNLKVQNSSTISLRYKSIIQRLNTDFYSISSDVAHGLFVGSYGRHTATNGISDIDMVFELPAEVYYKYDKYESNGQSALLQQVKKSIQMKYPSSDTGGDGQVVVISFSDNLKFDVLPVFLNKDGQFFHPDSNNGGSWKFTNPKPEIESIRKRNNECNKNLIPLCRMMRAWRSKWSVPIGGLLIDTLAYQFLANYENKDKSYSYYDWMCRDFFKWMTDQKEDQSYWFAPGSNQKVYNLGSFSKYASKCNKIAVEVIGHEAASPKREWSAKQGWREIFGTSFPT
jgi:hypothetical protein